jgi:hypothetical protein
MRTIRFVCVAFLAVAQLAIALDCDGLGGESRRGDGYGSKRGRGCARGCKDGGKVGPVQ